MGKYELRTDKVKQHKNFIMSVTNAAPTEAAKAAKLASHVLATLPTSSRNDALTAIHKGLTGAKDEILAANARDLELAREAAETGGLSLSIVSRLDLGKKGKWEDMLQGILDVRELEDPGEFAVCSSSQVQLHSSVTNTILNSGQSHIQDEA